MSKILEKIESLIEIRLGIEEVANILGITPKEIEKELSEAGLPPFSTQSAIRKDYINSLARPEFFKVAFHGKEIPPAKMMAMNRILNDLTKEVKQTKYVYIKNYKMPIEVLFHYCTLDLYNYERNAVDYVLQVNKNTNRNQRQYDNINFYFELEMERDYYEAKLQDLLCEV